MRNGENIKRELLHKLKDVLYEKRYGGTYRKKKRKSKNKRKYIKHTNKNKKSTKRCKSCKSAKQFR